MPSRLRLELAMTVPAMLGSLTSCSSSSSGAWVTAVAGQKLVSGAMRRPAISSCRRWSNVTQP